MYLRCNILDKKCVYILQITKLVRFEYICVHGLNINYTIMNLLYVIYMCVCVKYKALNLIYMTKIDGFIIIKLRTD